jgi:excisionase family DNA binding protein
MVEDELFTLPQIAEMLHVNPSTVRLWVNEQRLAAHKAGGRKWLVRRSELERMLNDHPNMGIPKSTTAAAKTAAAVKKTPERAAFDLASSIKVLGGIR